MVMAEDRGEGTVGPIQYAWARDRGLKRPTNEDAIQVQPIPWWHGMQALVVAVADGLGGLGGGGPAAEAAIATIADCAGRWQAEPIPASWAAVYAGLLQAFIDSKERICHDAAARGERAGATTLLAAVVTKDAFVHLYCGDSRLYHFSGVGEPYVTRDQSLARIYLDVGRIKNESEATVRQRNTLFSVVGAGPSEEMTVEPEWRMIETADGAISADDAEQHAIRPVLPGDILILCSDGLWGAIDEDQLITEVLQHGEEIGVLRNRLLKQALDAGGLDNITIAVIRIAGLPVCETPDESSPRQ